MRKLIRTAVREIERAGAHVVSIRDASKHTEILITGNGHTGIVRVHLGSKVHFRNEQRSVRANARKIVSGRSRDFPLTAPE